MQDQNLALYRVFYAVAKNKNITKAAKELFISQPAISKDISKLEANLNCTLFLRTSRGVSLTKEGELLFHHIHSAFSSIEAGEYALSVTGGYGKLSKRGGETEYYYIGMGRNRKQ